MIKNITTLTDVYHRMQQSFIKKGQRSRTNKMIDTGLFALQLRLKRPITFLLCLFLYNTNIFVEAQTKSLFDDKIISPVAINFNRRLFLILKWFCLALKNSKQNINLLNKFIKEFLLIVNNEQSETLNYRVWNNIKATQNRANTHYRW